MATTKKGWWRDASTDTRHYFNQDEKALCGGFTLLAPHLVSIRDAYHSAPNNCSACEALRPK